MPLRDQFPILQQMIDGHPLVYLDSAATAQKPRCVIETARDFYFRDYGNVKRGMHPLAERSTERYEAAREAVRAFLHAKKRHEIIFTRGTTEGINLIARSWGEANLHRGDTVLLSLLEHHSNIVPWLQLTEKVGLRIAWIGLNANGTLDAEDAAEKIASLKPKLVALTCVSNVLGVITPYQAITKLAHEHGALVLLDAAQLAPHGPIDVQAINCDFLAFSGHKLYGPTGIGVLYGKEELLKSMPPFLGGGMMIEEVTQEGFSPTHLPDKFEAGTPPIGQAIGLHAAIDFLTGIGWEAVQSHENDLLTYTLRKLSLLPFLTILGPKEAAPISGCISFIAKDIHPHDLTEYVGRMGVCLRAGHHCTQPLHKALGHIATTRLSIGIYNTEEDIDRACEALEEAWKFFRKA